ncbi:hypothetical protein UlMin_004009 [Ulmus minor]
MTASPSSSSSGVDPSQHKYDVFISFRGDETRLKFTSHLYRALIRNDIKAYIDEISLEKGEVISRALPKAIEESAISIIVFSKDYASSTWCLVELVQILKCQKEKSQKVLPIFYEVDPSNIRKQEGSYHASFVKHEQRFSNEIEKVRQWRQALKEAAGISGWDSQGKSEASLVDEVVKDVKEKLKYTGEGVKNMLDGLETDLESANKFLEDAEEKQLTDENVRKWLLEMKEVMYSADALKDKIKYEEMKRKAESDSEAQRH